MRAASRDQSVQQLKKTRPNLIAMAALASLFMIGSCVRGRQENSLTLNQASHSASFEVSVDLRHLSWRLPTFEPKEAAVRVVPLQTRTGEELRVFAVRDRREYKKQEKQELVWLDFYYRKSLSDGLRNAKLRLQRNGKSLSTIDVTVDTVNDQESTAAIGMESAAPGGYAHSRVLISESLLQEPISAQISGTPTAKRSVASAPIALSRSGRQLWATSQSTNSLSVTDTSTFSSAPEIIEFNSGPSSVTLTQDDRHAIVTFPKENVIRVFDTATKQQIRELTRENGVGIEPRQVALSSNGQKLVVSNFVERSVSVFNHRGQGDFTLQTKVNVGPQPHGISIDPSSSQALVSHLLPRGVVTETEAFVSVINLNTGEKTESTLQDSFNPDEGGKCIARAQGFGPEYYASMGESVSTGHFGVFHSPGGGVVWLPGSPVMPMPIWEGNTDAIDSQGGRGGFGFGVVWTFSSRSNSTPTPLLSPVVGQLAEAKEDFLKCFRPRKIMESITPIQILIANINAFVNEPQGSTPFTEISRMRHMTFTRNGRVAFLLGYGSNELMVMDGDTMHPLTNKHFHLPGNNPNGIVLSPDDTTAYVSYDNSNFVSVLDVSHYAKHGEPKYVPYAFAKVPRIPSVSVTTNQQLLRTTLGVPEKPKVRVRADLKVWRQDPLSTEMRLGRVLFHTSDPVRFPQMTRTRGASCAVCHVDGGGDGSIWSTVEGERRTTSMRGGTKNRGWLHASATKYSIEKFADVISKERLGGTGLSERQLESLSLYVHEGIPKLQPPELDAAKVQRGQEIFQAKCSSCHQGEKYTSGGADPDRKWTAANPERRPAVFDIGTATNNAGGLLTNPPFIAALPEKMQNIMTYLYGDRDLGEDDPVQQILEFEDRGQRKKGRFKAPSLVNVREQLMYFHDGSVATLEGALKRKQSLLNEKLRQEVSDEEIEKLRLEVSDEELDLLEEFLNSI